MTLPAQMNSTALPLATSLATLDWVVLVAYFVITLAVGLAAIRRVGDSEGFFLGHRGFGKVLMMAQSFGIGTHAEQPVSLAGVVYRSGFAGIWYQWKNMFATPFYWVMAPVFRRCRRTTTAQIVEDRYGPAMATLYTLFALTYFILNLGSMVKGAAKVIGVAGGATYSANQIILAMTVTFILYSFVGGLVASAWTNVFQCILQFVLSFLLIPLGWGLVGGMSGMKEAIANPNFFTLSTPGDITFFLILMLTLNGLVGIMAQPHILASVGTGRTESACRIGFTYGVFLKRICTIGWALVGLLVLAMALSGKLSPEQTAAVQHDPENSFGVACQRLLVPGLLGLLIASILADNMSAASAFMVDSGALFTRGFYDRVIAPGKTDRHYLWVGRFSGFAITMLSVVYAIFGVDKVLNSFLLTETLSTYFGISLLGGLIWHRANRWGAMASFFVALGVNFGLHHFRNARLDTFDPTVFGIALGSGIAALIIVSLLTPREGEAAQDLFHRLDSPAGDDEPGTVDSVPEPSAETTAASGTATGPRRTRWTALSMSEVAARGEVLLLPNLLRLRAAAAGQPIRRAYGKDIRGFTLAWVVVALVIGSAWVFLKF
jgi:Na+/proline symporter